MSPIKSVIVFGLPILGGFVLAPVISDVLHDGFRIYVDSDGPIPTAIGLFICSLAMAFIYNCLVNGVGKKTKIVLATVGALIVLAPVTVIGINLYEKEEARKEAKVLSVVKAERLKILETINCGFTPCDDEERKAFSLRPEGVAEAKFLEKVSKYERESNYEKPMQFRVQGCPWNLDYYDQKDARIINCKLILTQYPHLILR